MRDHYVRYFVVNAHLTLGSDDVLEFWSPSVTLSIKLPIWFVAARSPAHQPYASDCSNRLRSLSDLVFLATLVVLSASGED